MISKISECTINQYIRCLFDGDLSVLGTGTDKERLEAFQKIEIEFIDLSGQYESNEYETIRAIISLSSRIELINTLLYIEDQCLKEFNHPFLPAFIEFKRFGYNLIWNGDVSKFYDQLINIRSNEKQFEVELEIEKKKLKKPESTEEKPVRKRADFIRMLIGMQKQKYIIDRDKTTMEDLAIMISEIRELTIANELNNARE